MKILIIFPHGNALSTHSGSDTRVWNIISSLIKNNFDVFVLHSNKSKGFEDPDLKEQCNVHYYKELNILKAPAFYLTDLNPFFIIKLFYLIQKQKFDIIQITYPWGFFILKLLVRKKTFLIYDSLGIEGEFIKIALNNPKFPKIFKPFAVFYVKLYERLVCKLTDLIINVSELDRKYYIRNYKIKGNKAETIPIPSSLKRKKVESKELLKSRCREKLGLPKKKTIIIFHGTETHLPNREAFMIIKKFIAPNFRKRNVLFVLAGLNLKSWKKGNIISLGFVKNLEDLLCSADFAIVPIISGSGQRVKCSDYIIKGIPFVCTKKSIQGFDFLENGEDCLIYESVDEKFIEGIQRLCDSEHLRKKLHKNLLIKSKNIDSKKIDKKLINFYKKLKREY